MNGNEALATDKLPEIRGDLVRNDEDRQSWDFLLGGGGVLDSSICNDQRLKGESVLSSLGDDKVVNPVVVVKVGEIECRAELASGACSC